MLKPRCPSHWVLRQIHHFEFFLFFSKTDFFHFYIEISTQVWENLFFIRFVNSGDEHTSHLFVHTGHPSSDQAIFHLWVFYDFQIRRMPDMMMECRFVFLVFCWFICTILCQVSSFKSAKKTPNINAILVRPCAAMYRKATCTLSARFGAKGRGAVVKVVEVMTINWHHHQKSFDGDRGLCSHLRHGSPSGSLLLLQPFFFVFSYHFFAW